MFVDKKKYQKVIFRVKTASKTCTKGITNRCHALLAVLTLKVTDGFSILSISKLFAWLDLFKKFIGF